MKHYRRTTTDTTRTSPCWGALVEATALWNAIACALLLMAVGGCAAVSGAAKNVLPPDRQEQRKLEVARQFDQKRDRAEFEAALSAWQRGDTTSARQSLTAILQRNPQHRDAMLLMIEVCLAANEVNDAVRYAQTARNAFPNDPEVQYAAAIALDYANRPQEALACYQHAATLEPANDVYAVAYHAAREALSAPARSPAGKAVAASTAGTASTTGFVAKIPPGGRNESDGYEDIDTLIERAENALRAKNPELALALFREAAGRKPDDPQIVVRAATSALRHDHPDLAAELLEPLAGSSNLPAIHCTLAVAQYRLGDYRAAELSLRQALGLDNSSALAYFLMGCTLRKLGRIEQAEAHFRHAALLDARYAQRQ